MRRDLPSLSDNTYDVLIIGGGIYGATLAWEAQSRGLTVALVEKGDFASATSANSLKTIHGGLRYLQHADIKRMRESIGERAALMRIAPHLVHPLPVLVPTYGHGMKSKEVMFVALMLNDLLSFDRNRGLDAQKHIPRGRVISQQECLRIADGIDRQGLTGAAIFSDAQVYNSERLVLSFVRSAEEAGASIANYVEVIRYLANESGVYGVQVEDKLTAQRFNSRAKVVINTAGPWLNQLLHNLDPNRVGAFTQFAKSINVITRSLFEKYAVGLSSKAVYHDSDAVLNKGSRLYFIAPWRNHSIIGTDYVPYDGSPDAFRVDEADVERFLDEVNTAYPSAHLTLDDVDFVHGGLLPVTGIDPRTGAVQLAKHYQIYDHKQDGLQGLVSVTGVKYTTARNVAENTVNYVGQILGKSMRDSGSRTTALHDGEIADFADYLQSAIKQNKDELPEASVRQLVHNYGTKFPVVLAHLDDHPAGAYSTDDILTAEVRYAVREEMAQKLSDVVLRRTELGTAGYPGAKQVRLCAEIMGAELKWTQARLEQEIQDTNAVFPTWVIANDRSRELAPSPV